MRRPAFTLLEVLIALTAGLILLAAVLPAWQELNRLVLSDTMQEEADSDALRFLSLLRMEVFQAGYGLRTGPSLEVAPELLQLYADFNHDGDLDDPREWLRYRFDSATHRLSRSSGGSSFQTLLPAVEALEFQTAAEGCFTLHAQWNPEDAVEVSTFCPNTFQVLP